MRRVNIVVVFGERSIFDPVIATGNSQETPGIGSQMQFIAKPCLSVALSGGEHSLAQFIRL